MWSGEDGRWTGGRAEMQHPRGHEQDMTRGGRSGGISVLTSLAALVLREGPSWVKKSHFKVSSAFLNMRMAL